MRVILLVFVLTLLFVSRIDGSKRNLKSKFEGLESKSLDFMSNQDVSDGPFCKSLTAYYAGTLKNKNSGDALDVQFQIKLWVNDEKKKIHVYADKWNEKYSKSKDFELDFYYGGNRLWCDIYDDDCTAPLAKKDSSFKLDLNTASGNYFHLLNFNSFNNSFGLNKATGECSKHQLDGLNDNYTPDLTQLSFCVCCDSYTPDDLLGCPCNKWSNEAPTTKSIEVTTPSIRHEQTCQKLIGYYVGTFKDMKDPSFVFNAQFEFQTYANLDDRKIHFGTTHWNQSYLHDGNDELRIGYSGFLSCTEQGKDCTIPFVHQPTYEVLDITTGEARGGWFSILGFPSFNNSFKLNNTIDGCTNYQPFEDSRYSSIPDPSLFSYCLCCDKYDPHPSLNCPPNPWQN